jgi:pyruvate,water dikinase
VLHEPAHELPDGFDPATTILVAPSVDPGWMSTFGLVAGVAIELGGDLSHGSIVLRELGLPAVTNARGLSAHVSTGDRVHVDGHRGTVRIVR